MNTTEHLLTVLGEEGAEIAQDVSKCLRFGLDDVNVLNPSGPTNRFRLVAELNDLVAMADMLAGMGVIPANWSNPEKQKEKVSKVRKFMEYARKQGALTD